MSMTILKSRPAHERWRLRGEDKPLRAEPYSEDRLAQHAHELAGLLVCSESTRSDRRLLERFAENAAFLRNSITVIAAAERDGFANRRDAEWLLDNFYIVEEQLREIFNDLPHQYYDELPKIDSGEPRVYAVALELVSHTDSVLEEESIVRFLNEFQTVAPLSMGELWAVPIMLRLVLMENLRRIAAQILSAHASELKAEQLFEEWVEGSKFPIELVPIHEAGSLIFHLIEKLQLQGACNHERLRQLEQHLASQDLTPHQVIHLEHQRQASSQVSIGNVITSIRLICAIDWIAFFERTSLVEQILRRDPASVYPQMDFESRDRYRHIVEELTDGSNYPETEVAETLVGLAENHSGKPKQASHIGYWLTNGGRRELEVKLDFHPKFGQRVARVLKSNPNTSYIGGIGLITLIALAICDSILANSDVSIGWILLFNILALLPVSEIAVGFMNTLITTWLRPRLLPKFDFSTGIPRGYKAIVVVPSMLSSKSEADSLVDRLEVHYLANPDPALSFALLTDFPDAPKSEMPSDAEILERARAGIRGLNTKHFGSEEGHFYLFHRTRQWNEKQSVWMGWERKRGKLQEFNRLLRGQNDTSYEIKEGAIHRLLNTDEGSDLQYVITLDSDTTIPHNAAQKLVATLAHPLNAPVFDETTNSIRSGYVLLQPRATSNLASAQSSHFSKIFANNPGIDPYATSASDVYQDLYGEGSFIGKGIYHIDSFNRCVAGAFPDNQILSHDLIEGCHSRVGLVSDIELFDNYPARYEADAKRQHRWVRGDWQIAPWLLPVVPTATNWTRNRLSCLSRWKIFDNLRRSLTTPALMLFLVVGWLSQPDHAWLFTTVGLLVLAIPMIVNLRSAVRGWSRSVAFNDFLKLFWIEIERSTLQTVVTASLLPHRAWLMVDAIGRTLTRMLITHRNLLEWETASAVEHRLSSSKSVGQSKWLLIPALTCVLSFFLRHPAFLGALPFLFAWLASPPMIYWLSLPPRNRVRDPLTLDETVRLRLIARKIWAFFEHYVTANDNWLPPDNVQEYPQEKIASRISPTNEGLFLVSGLVARDFGYVSLHSLTELYEHNLSSWLKFDRFHGHFYNWYDTRSLKPLYPRYVSTVDSGNLFACFLTLKQGIEDLRHAPIMANNLIDGLQDTVRLVTEVDAQVRSTDDRRILDSWKQFIESIDRLKSCTVSSSRHPAEWRSCVERCQSMRAEIANQYGRLATKLDASHRELPIKISLLLNWLDKINLEFELLCPWWTVIHEVVAKEDPENLQRAPQLRWWTNSAALDEHWQQVWDLLGAANTLSKLRQIHEQSAPALDAFLRTIDNELNGSTTRSQVDSEAPNWARKLALSIHAGAEAAESLDQRLQVISDQLDSVIHSTDFRILYNPQRHLFSIGFNLDTGTLDTSHYDLLCSEARLASYVAIAKGDVAAKHWFRLGRQLTQTAHDLSLLSWGGTMFEYMMPHLFQNNYEDSLLSKSCRTAIARQQEYGRQRSVPWGISECAFGALAVNSDYHYRSFGVPGLGLKRGLSKDLVISPYSTLISVDTDPHAAIANLSYLEKEGGNGPWGFYEAIDFTPERVPTGKRSIVVRCYMTHHHGMSMLAIGNLLFNAHTRRRFHNHSMVKATELLLQERVPVVMPRMQSQVDESTGEAAPKLEEELVSRRIVGVDTIVPRVQLLSNGQYSVMITSTGGGYSQCNQKVVTRWRSDPTRDHWGQFIYLRDVKSGKVWSTTYQPTGTEPNRYEVIYSVDKAEFFRRDGYIETHLEVIVSPENNAEIRQLKITNNGDAPKDIEVTSYVEVCLTELAADRAHSSYQKLFVETEYVAEKTALLAKRRPRDSRIPEVWAMHALSANPEISSTVEFETSRQQFLGRGRTYDKPVALDPGSKLSGTAGAVLDPIFSLRCHITVSPHESVSMAFTTSVIASRDEAIALADQYHDPRCVQRAFELAWAFTQVELRHLHLSPTKMHLYQRLASGMIYPDQKRRPPSDRIQLNQQTQKGLWRHGISGDRPMMVVYVTKPEHVELARETLEAHLHWKGRGLVTDLIIVNDFPGSYFDAIHENLIELMQDMQVRLDEKPQTVFLLRGSQIPREDKILLDAVASIVLYGDRGSLARQSEAGLAARTTKSTIPARQLPSKLRLPSTVFPIRLRGGNNDAMTGAQTNRYGILSSKELEFWNGYGGFAYDGREYHIRLTLGRTTPMPWSNVIANPQFGCLLTESGGGYTWFGNSRENKLTSWANDPVTDPPSELLYICDCETSEITSPFSSVVRDTGDYGVHHGQGYSRFVHESLQLSQEVFVSIAAEDPVKFVVVTVRNERRQPRRLSVTYFAEWVLGVTREQSQMNIVTAIDEKTGAILATNSYHPEYASQVVFLRVFGERRSVCGDRTEFIGRNGSLDSPTALGPSPLSDRTGAGLDPCGAVQSYIQLNPGEEREIIFLLGAAENASDAQQLLQRYSSPEQIREAITDNISMWNETLESIEIKSPNRAFDLLVNRWLPYQTLSCRIWGRSAYYQSGGAFGFRDQLQDVMALVYSRPDLARKHILLAASRQYVEGDVQHWWHPPEGRGTRTRFSDDLLWLPFVVCQYLAVTSDESILDESTSFLDSPPLSEEEQERYELPQVSSEQANLYEHCRRTISRGFQVGSHGLPLMGCGDWNDGMNKVGEGGKGESVWVGWFLLVILERFLPIMERRGDLELAGDLRERAAKLRQAIEDNAWDGEWYRRAYFDDGTPLGSMQNDECQIDSLAQTWAVIAGGNPVRSRAAIESVMKNLVKWKNRLVLLFTPPFDETKLDPGYVKGYIPGTRENGGQYTHAAAWLIQALATMHDGDSAVKVFDLINPINNSSTRLATEKYQVEPYVVAADVYSAKQHIGRGGWTWYTGSAAWLYRAAIEFILGFELKGDSVTFQPRIPKDWNEFELHYKRGTNRWDFHVIRNNLLQVDRNQTQNDAISTGTAIPLTEANRSNEIVVTIDEISQNKSNSVPQHGVQFPLEGTSRQRQNGSPESETRAINKPTLE